ncbi:MAG: secretin N-terminal domain-containing protein [Planctomycetota bacterium]
MTAGVAAGGLSLGATPAAVVLSAGLPVGLGVGVAAAQDQESASGTIEFQFKDTRFADVIDFFARETGVPVIFETDPPSQTMTFVGGRPYEFDEALTILNLNLQRFNCHLRREQDFLYLSTLPGAAKRTTEVFGDLPEGVRPDQIVTVTLPLNNASAATVKPQIQPLVGSYGSVVEVPEQNMLVLVETAAQVERIRGVVEAIDKVRPVNSTFRVFKLERAKPDAVVSALQGLVGQRVRQVINDRNGAQRIVENVELGGLTLQPDARMNAVIAVGPQTRIDLVEDLVGVLDAPSNPMEGGGSEMVTIGLQTVAADEAARQVGRLFDTLPPERRPKVIPLTSVGKLTLVGSSALLTQARALVSQIDPASGEGDERILRAVPLEHIEPITAQNVASSLMTPRQKQVVKLSAAPDGSSLIVVGPAGDVDSLSAVVRGIDRPSKLRKDVRLIDVTAPDPEAALARAVELYEATLEKPSALSRSFEAESRTLTLVGPREEIDAFSRVLQTTEDRSSLGRETRTFAVEAVRPSKLVPPLSRLAGSMLDADDGARFEAPSFEAVDELGTLVVRAAPGQFAVIEDLVEKLTQDAVSQTELRVIRVRSDEPARLIARAEELYAERARGLPEAEAGEVGASMDDASGNLVLRGTPGGLTLFERALADAQKFVPPGRTTKLIDVQRVDASEVVEPLRELLSTADPIDPSREVPEPTVRVMERTNSLLVTAEDAQHRVIADFVRRLDVLEPAALPPLKLLQLRTADAAAIAQMLTRQYDTRSQADRVGRPVQVRSDPATNTLIVSAHEELFPEIKEFVEELNRDRTDGPERVTVLFSLKVARAVEVAEAMDKLYPQPPMPRDRYGRPLPWAQEPKEVTVSADAGSNSLILDAPADRIESLQELAQQLDRVEVPPAASLRTYRVEEADLGVIASALSGLARRGVLSAPAQAGKQRVEVLIETETRSNTLIVAGDEVTFAKVEQVLSDLSAVARERELRIVPIANSPAEEVRRRAVAIFEAQMAGLGREADLSVSVDAESNSLEIVADAERLGRFLDILDELQRQAGPARQARILDLRFAQAADVIAFLEDLSESSRAFTRGGGPEPVFEPIEATNSLLVAAQPAQFAIIEQLVRTVDNQETSERPPLRILRLRSTDAQNLAQILNQSYAQRSSDERAKRPVSIQPDTATNTLVISAHPEVLPEIESIVSELNETQALDDEDREIRIFPLRIARAQELAQTIDAMFPEPPMPRDRYGRPRPELQQPKEISVRADPATNSLIVDAPAKRLAGFEQIVRSLDAEQISEKVEVRTYRVERAEIAAVGDTLRRLAQSNAFGALGRTPVTVSEQPATNTLVVAGPVSVFAQLEPVLTELDTPDERPATSLRMYPLANARAERLEPLIEQLLVTRVRDEVRGRGLTDNQERSLLEVASDTASNTLIVTAPEAVQAVAGELIESLDTRASAAGRSVVRVVPLTFADAGEVAAALQQTIPTMELAGGVRPTVIAPGGSNAIVLSGVAADLDRLEALIEPLDQRPTDEQSLSLETFDLEHADATRIARTVQTLLSDQLQNDPRLLSYRLRYSRGEFVPPPEVRVEADARTNSLVVSAPASTLELARSMIDRLDRPAAATDRSVMTFTPARAEPARLVETVSRVLNETVPPGRDPIELIPEPATGSVVVIGPEEQIIEAVSLLAEFDERTVSVPGVEVRLFALENASAGSAAGAVQSMIGDRARWPRELLAAERAGVAVARPTVSPDADENRLVVSAPAALMPMVEAVVETLDTPSERRTTDVRVFRLARGDAEGVAVALREGLGGSQRPGEAPVRVTAETRANAVVVSASRERLLQAEGIVAELDQAATTDGSGVRTIFLKHARAERLAPVVQGVLERDSGIDAVPWWERLRLMSAGVQTPPPVRVVPEASLNAMVVSGPTGAIELAEQLASELDIDPSLASAAPERLVRVITLRNADARELADNLAVLTEDASTAEAPPAVRVDAASNSLIVRATPSQLEEIERLAETLDGATVTGTRQLRRIAIDRSRADAAELAEALRRLIGEQSGRGVEVITVDELLRRSGGDAAPAGGAVQPSTSQPNTGQPGAMLPASAVPGALLNGSPRWPHAWVLAAAMAQPAFVTEPPQPDSESADDRPEDGPVTIAVDPETNSLIILGSPRLTDRVAELSRQLEREFPAAATRVRVVELPSGVDPAGVARTVQLAMRQLGRATADNPGGTTGRVSVVGDRDAGNLIVFANDTDFELVAPIVRALSVATQPDAVTVKVYPLESVSAQTAVQAVRDFVSPRPVGRQAQGVRPKEITLDGVTREIDPSLVSVGTDPAGTALVITAPDDAMKLIDRFVGLIDQSPVADRLAIRGYTLKNGRAADASRAMQRLFDSQRAGTRNVLAARFVADSRTNTLYVTATSAQHDDVERLLPEFDVELADAGGELAVIPLRNARPSTVRDVVQQVVIGLDQAKQSSIRISADDRSNLFVVRAGPEEVEQIRSLIAELDSGEAAGLPIRTIRLERADAEQVARALTGFFRERSRLTGARGTRPSGVAVTGDRASGSLVVAADDADFEQIRSMAETFDRPSPALGATFEIIRLEHAQASDVGGTVQDVAWQIQGRRMRTGGSNAPFFAEVNGRTNSLVIYGEKETLDVVRELVSELDRPLAEELDRVVRSVRLERADPNAVASVLRETFQTPGWRSWRGADPLGVNVVVDRRQRSLLIVGQAERVEAAVASATELDSTGAGASQPIVSIPLTHARATAAERSLNRFFQGRARERGVLNAGVSVIGSDAGNVLLVSGDEESVELVRELVADLDRPELGEDREIRVLSLEHAAVAEVARSVRAMFPASRSDERVIVTEQGRDGSLIVSAPGGVLGRVEALVSQLDAPPDEDRSRIVTVVLENARASDVARSLREALPDGLRLRITSVDRNNSLLLTGSEEAIGIGMTQIEQLDAEPVRSLTEFRKFAIANADAFDVSYSLRTLFSRRSDGREARIDYDRGSNSVIVAATADVLEEVEQVVAELDAPVEGGRRTEFVPLEFAESLQIASALDVFYGPYAFNAETAEARNVTIVPDEASNSLIVSAAESEWEGIRALLSKLDSERYDTSRRLEVIALRYASADSVARAISEGFDQTVRDRARRERAEGRGRRDGDDSPVILLSEDETPSVSAEPETNSLIVFAANKQLERIRRLVERIDRAEFADFPEARVIAVEHGVPSRLAARVREVFVQSSRSGRRGVVIVGDDESSSLVVRAEDDEFVQIRALAESLQSRTDESMRERVRVRLLALENVPAVRVRDTLTRTFGPVAQERGERLVIEIDAASNALVIASSDDVYEQLEPVAQELDAAVGAGGRRGNIDVDERPAGGLDPKRFDGAAGQTVAIVTLTRTEPGAMQRLAEQLGLTREQQPGEPGVVARPVRVVAMSSRSAVAVVGDPPDVEAAASVIGVLDAEGSVGVQAVAMVPLRVADAAQVAQTVRELLRPKQQDVDTPAARAIAEQVRRLRVAGLSDAELDLNTPVRLVADAQTNSVLIASSAGNVDALTPLIASLDGLPVGDAVVVRMFPLENAAASRIKSIVDELFSRGEELARVAGTDRAAEPTTVTGRVLSGELAASVDERTNTLIVAGREEAVAFVEVLVADLDGEGAGAWVEPRLIELTHADPLTVAEVLRGVMSPGPASTPEAQALQRQTGRLRMVQEGMAGDFDGWLEADVFAPLTRLSVLPDPTRRAILVVGTPANIAVARELVSIYDVPEAALLGQVRVFPLSYAAANRVEQIVNEVFRARQRLPEALPEDEVAVSSDVRTNTLIVSTSERSLRVLVPLIERLDSEESSATVGLHVLPVVGADADELASKIDRLMRERMNAARRGSESPLDAFRIEPEPATNSLIVAASDENLRVVRELLDALTSDETLELLRDRQVEVVPLRTLQADEAAQAVVELYARQENRLRGDNAVRVVPNARLRALLVSGSVDDLANIRTLLGRLDGAEVTTVREVQRIELTTANAFEVVQLVETLISGDSVAGPRGTAQATRLRYLRTTPSGEAVTEASIDPLLREQVQLDSDLRTNSVLVTAPGEVMGLIQAVIKDLDSTSAGARKIRRYLLTNADARAMAEVLSDLFNLERRGSRFVLVPSRVRTQQEEDQLGQQTLTPVPDERQQLSITVDARTNTLLVSGTAEFLELVGEVVIELDKIEAQERQQFVVTLNNASADEVQRVLAQYFREESDRLRATLGPEQAASVARRLDREVTVVGDTQSQKVLVSASPRYEESVRQIIAELDAAPPQVLIQVLLAEVTLDSEDQFGLDFTGTGVDNQYTGSTLAGGAGSAGVATVLGTANLTLASDDFNLLVRALEVQGKLEVLSSPQVTVNNNEPARIQVGENISLPEDVERLDNGNTRANVRREDVGVIVDVTPSISDSGFVRLDIQPEISAVTTRTTQITADFSAPIISTRRVETTVTVRDGQTVVIGGLIENSFEERETQVPILGSIPFLGIPFRSKDVSSRKTELLVILTPRIVPGARDGIEPFREVTRNAINRTTDPERLLRVLPEQDLWPEASAMPGAPSGMPRPISDVGPYAPTPRRQRGEPADPGPETTGGVPPSTGAGGDS